jgi:hypothetical protein
MESLLNDDCYKGLSVAELRKKYPPEFVREHYNPIYLKGPFHWKVEYLHWLFKECLLDINSIEFEITSNRKPLTISLLDEIYTRIAWGKSKYNSICFLLSMGAKSRLGLDILIRRIPYKWFENPYILPCVFMLLDVGGTPALILQGDKYRETVYRAYHSRLATRAACIAVISLHGKLPAGQVAQQCLSRDMLRAVAQAIWAKRIQVMEESAAAAEGL